MNAPRRISPHFTLSELTATEHREFLAEQSNPPPEILLHLNRLAFDYLEPARAILGPLRVNSGWRCKGLNTAIGGSPTSRHIDGLAADVFPLEVELSQAYVKLVQSGIAFDQLIFEFGRWLHLGGVPPGLRPRGHLLAIYEPGKYLSWDDKDPRFRSA